MTHQIACLIHYLAATPGKPRMLLGHDELLAALPDAVALGVARNPDLFEVVADPVDKGKQSLKKLKNRVDRDNYWAELTPEGERLAMESLCTLETEG